MPERVTQVVDGVDVTCEVIWRESDYLEVKIVSPYAGLSASSTVPGMRRRLVDLTGPAGDRRIHDFARLLYSRAQYLDEHRADLKALGAKTKELLIEMHLNDFDRPEAVCDQRQVLRRRFKSGEIEQRKFQSGLKFTLRMARDHEERRDRLIEAFQKAANWDASWSLPQIFRFLDEEPFDPPRS